MNTDDQWQRLGVLLRPTAPGAWQPRAYDLAMRVLAAPFRGLRRRDERGDDTGESCLQSLLAPGGVPRWLPENRMVNDAVPDDEEGARVKARRMMLGALFFEHEICSDPDVAARVVRERAADAESAFEEVAPKLWFRNTPPSMIASGAGVPMRPTDACLGMTWAGPGSGLGEMHALNALGWTTQKPARAVIAVLEGVAAPLRPTISHKERSNTERRRLGWAEVTLLEALRMLHMAELSLSEVRELLDLGVSYRRMGPFAQFRRDEIAAVMSHEPPLAPDRASAAESVLSAMPEYVDARDWRDRRLALRPQWMP